MEFNKFGAWAFLCGALIWQGVAVSQEIAIAPAVDSPASSQVLSPLSDPENKGGWVLRSDISDEFSGDKIDPSKWFVQGAKDEYYIWKGRAPSQFAPHNVLVQDGKLKLRSQWEPDFKFATDEGHEGNTYAKHDGKVVPVTTAGVITRKRILNGYMECRTKAADSAMTSSFWCIGYESELDIYEQMGRPKVAKGDIMGDTLKSSVHDWQSPAKRPTRRFGGKDKLPFRVADDFHVYGCEWGQDYLKMYVDGKLIYSATQAKEGKNWVITNPLEIWFDSEIFVWLGLPGAADLPCDYEIDYLRVWQKPRVNLIDRGPFSFEGPFLFQDMPRPLTLVPENSENNDYQKFWVIDDASLEHFSVVRHEKFAAGTRSLKFESAGELSVDVAKVESPEGTLALPAGDLVFTAKVWIDPKSEISKLNVTLLEPEVRFSVDLSGCEKGKWVAVKGSFNRSAVSGAKDRMQIAVGKDATAAGGLFYVDEITIVKPKDEEVAVAFDSFNSDQIKPDNSELSAGGSVDDKAKVGAAVKADSAKKAASDKTKEEWVALSKAKWEKNGWKWNQAKVESNFDEMDADNDGIATGLERKQWFEKRAKKKQ